MQKQIITCTNLGMHRDVGISQLSEKAANYAFENHNIRITAINDNTLYTVTNEKGTQYTGVTLQGTFLGSCKLGKFIVVFTADTSLSYIYRISYNGTNFILNTLYQGNLNFTSTIDAIGYYESEEILKVYWVDGVNPNRFINIADIEGSAPDYSNGTTYLFDFLGHINNIPKVNITKNYSKAGIFQAGTILYFITYYNKFGTETCIAWLSDLLYISFKDRGAKPEETVSCAFDIDIENTDDSYNYIRIYAIYRASKNGAAEGRIVADISIDNNSSGIHFTDYGNNYQNYNAADLHYVGGQNIVAGTLDYKQDTLFLGDIQLKDSTDISQIREFFKDKMVYKIIQENNLYVTNYLDCPYISWEYKKVDGANIEDLTKVGYTLQISQSLKYIAGFKHREFYRFGIQFMTSLGDYTPIIWIGDKYCDLPPTSNYVIPEKIVEYKISFYLEDHNTKTTGYFYKVFDINKLTYLDGYYLKANVEGYGTCFWGYYHGAFAEPYIKDYTKEESVNFIANLSKLEGYDETSSMHKKVENEVVQEALIAEGTYIANAKFIFPEITDLFYSDLFSSYKAYRLVVAENDYSNSRILTLGVINPTMFNYRDRENNQPFAINSWLFRPRQSDITHKHYYSMPTQDLDNAEILGVMKKKFPGYTLDSSNQEYDAFALVFAPNYLAGCRLWYKLIYYKTNSCSDYIRNADVEAKLTDEGKEGVEFSDTAIFTGKAAALAISRDNQFLSGEETELIPWHFKDYSIVSQGLIKDSSWEGIASKTISALTEDLKKLGLDILINLNMLPTADLYKEAKRLGGSEEILTYIGLAIALAASVVASVFSFGAAAPAVAATAITISTLATTAALTAAGSAAVVAAIGAAAGITAIAENEKYNENALDIEKQLAKKGITCINNGENKGKADDMTNTLLNAMFENYDENDTDKFYLGGDLRLGSTSNFYIMGGRLTTFSDKQQDTINKSDSYYVDESIVTLNTPDVEDINNNLTLGDSYRLDLVGTIPIHLTVSDYLIYAEQGLSSQASVIPGEKTTTEDIKGLINGFLYQDTVWPSPFPPSDYTLEDLEILTLAAVLKYKTYMWHRNTSLSMWSPRITIKDPYNNVITSPPAKSTKKIFANYRYSGFTNYKSIKTININTPILYTYTNNLLSTIEYTGKNYYLGNIDSIIIPLDDYTLWGDQGRFPNKTEDISVVGIKDPISLKYKSSSHIVIPLTPYKMVLSTILPTILGEKGSNIIEYYNINNLGNLSDKEITVLGYTNLFTEKKYHSFYDLGLAKLNESLFNKEIWASLNNVGDYYEIKDYKNSYAVFLLYYMLSTEDKKNLINGVFRNFLKDNNYEINGTEITTIHTNNYSDILESMKELNYESAFVELMLKEITHIFGISSFLNSVFFQVTYHSTDYIGPSYKTYEYIALNQNSGKLQYRTFFPGIVRPGRPTATSSPSGTLIPKDTILYLPNKDLYYKITEESYRVMDNILLEINFSKYLSVIQDKIDWEENSSYLFMGELCKKSFSYDEWHGGTSDYALLLIDWNVCSELTTIGGNTNYTWGDTFFQRWDCLKTFPYTENDNNGIVEVLSFMVESRNNLDGRSDINRGIENLINLRSSNSNLFNNVYSLQDNFFSYKILDKKFDKTKFRNLIVWSLSKQNLDNIDNWTSISAVNTLQLDGKMGAITKIINVNDTLLTFLELGISTIDYNLQSALTTYEGVPLQMGNTGKVTGYTKVTDDIGCSNKKALCLSEAGLFFIDNNLKSLYLYTTNKGISNISNTGGFNIWFKENLDSKFTLSYDSMTSDLYISNDKYCLVYNTTLGSFISFMDYINTPLLINILGKSIAFNQTQNNTVDLHTLFEGPYDKIYGVNSNYSIEYRLNPSPYTDNLFTNYLYMADWTSPNTKSNDTNLFNNTRFDHFDTVKAWNEYLLGELSTNIGSRVLPLKAKFRIWRGDIPRDGDTLNKRVLKGDRMRNPWIHLKFTKDNINNTKMTFHNLNVIYYN